MRYYAIHAAGYGGSDIRYPVFEIESDGPEAVPSAVFPIAGVSSAILTSAINELKRDPKTTAAQLAWLTGGQHVGWLAEKDSDAVVYGTSGPIKKEDQFPWQELNSDDVWSEVYADKSSSEEMSMEEALEASRVDE